MSAPLDRAIESSSGWLAYRVAFDGVGTEFVSLEEMARARVAITDVERVAGLDSTGLQFKETCDLVRAHWEPSGFKLRVLAEVGTPVFHQDPTAVTYLNEDRVTAAEATFEVTGAEAFPSQGVIYMGTETMYFDARDDHSFGGLTRGLWSIGGQAAQYHYRSSEFVSDDRLSVPEITDQPVVFEGRRVYVYAYAAGDDLQGDGTRIWTGLCSTDPVCDGEYWSWTTDPLNRLFAFDLASDLADDFGLRGAYYSVLSPLWITIREWDTAAIPTDADSIANEVSVRVIGLFDNRQELLGCVNYLLDAETSSWSGWSVSGTGGVRAEARGESWGLIYRTPSSPLHRWIELHVDSMIDGASPARIVGQGGSAAPWAGEPGGAVGLSPNNDYLNLYRQGDGSFALLAPGGGGTFPRVAYATTGAFAGLIPVEPSSGAGQYTYETSDGVFDAGNLSAGFGGYALQYDRLVLNAPVTMVPGRTSLYLEWDALDPAPEGSYPGGGITGLGQVIADRGFITPPDGAPRVTVPDGASAIASAQSSPKITVERLYVAQGNLADFIQQLIDDRAEFLNLGLAPDLRPDDFDTGWDEEIRELAAAASLLNERSYVAGTKIDLDDLIENDLRLLGAHPHFSLEGRFRFRALRPPSETEVIDVELDVDNLVTQGQWFKYEPSQIGIFNRVHHQTAYDPIADEFTGSWNFKWQPGFSRVPGGRTLEVAPKSVDPAPRLPEHDAQRILGASRVLATFGERYAVLTVSVLRELFKAIVGDVATVTWSKLPNGKGGFGAKLNARVIGREHAPSENAYGSLTLLISRARYGGYAPGARCEPLTGTSGGTGPFVATVDLASYFPAGTDLLDFLEVGDLIEVHRWGHRVADRHDATITALTSSTLTFTTDVALDHSGYSWAWGARRATEYAQTDNLAEFAFEADASSRIDFSDGTAPRMVLAP